jgi:sortase A
MFVAAAALLAWHGMGGTGGGVAANRPTETLAGRAQPVEPQATGSLSIGGLPTRVVVARAGIDAAISEVGVVREDDGATWETAWRSVGHHIDSSMPGQPGNMVLTGHVSVADRSNLAIFSHLDSVRPGDVVEVFSGDQVYRYAVSNVSVVAPSAVKILRSSESSTVTLITCTHDLKSRLVVVATLV